MLKQVALIGSAPTWRDAPFHEEDEAWQIWAHASCQPLHPSRVDRWFDLHTVETWRQGKTWYRPWSNEPATYVEWLATRIVPVMMQAHYPIVPASQAYPLQEIVEAFEIVPKTWNLTPGHPDWWRAVKDRGEFTSTVSYMIALALFQGVEELALYGIDFIGQDPAGIERSYQRAGAKYWVGVARGMGVPVTVARGSWFEQAPWLYGYQPTPTRPQEVLV